jgi:hypothetical protein
MLRTMNVVAMRTKTSTGIVNFESSSITANTRTLTKWAWKQRSKIGRNFDLKLVTW